MAQSAILITQQTVTETKKMTEESKIEVPNFKATSDGKRKCTPKQWLERFRQYTKRKHKMDITELIRGVEISQIGWSGKEAEIQEPGKQNRTRHYQTLSKTFSDYSTNIFYRSETLITTAENFLGQDKPNPKHSKTSGGG